MNINIEMILCHTYIEVGIYMQLSKFTGFLKYNFQVVFEGGGFIELRKFYLDGGAVPGKAACGGVTVLAAVVVGVVCCPGTEYCGRNCAKLVP